MKPRLLLAITIGIFMLGFVQISNAQAGDNAVVNSFITRQADREKGEEYEDARKILRGDVDGDRKTDLVVLYTLEGFGGGNDHRQYIAIFLGKGKGFRYATNDVVGGKFYRGVELRSITAGKIDLDTMEYRKTDAACCPSKKGKTSYIFSKGKLKETK